MGGNGEGERGVQRSRRGPLYTPEGYFEFTGYELPSRVGYRVKSKATQGPLHHYEDLYKLHLPPSIHACTSYRYFAACTGSGRG